MKHPYQDAADYRRWNKAISGVDPLEVDPVVEYPFRLTRQDGIVTAGSCFAQHIARHLKQRDFNYLVTEPGHPLLDDRTKEAFGYGTFSARFGNIYTSRQLLQLFHRAYGAFSPVDSMWQGRNGGVVDPFRPNIQPCDFSSERELEVDREQHFRAVRRAFEGLDVSVFTFGLTECWASSADGAVFPLAPGVAGGTFDQDRYVFLNLTVDEVVRDMRSFIDSLRSVNRSARIILTVSPVPLMATAVDRHVLVSTTYSKSVLRVAAQMLVESIDDVHYFPSYEIITGNFSRGSYFANDLRSVTEAGVQHVMSLFFRHATTDEGELPGSAAELADAAAVAARAFDEETDSIVRVDCDEELLAMEASEARGAFNPRADGSGRKGSEEGTGGGSARRELSKRERAEMKAATAAARARRERSTDARAVKDPEGHHPGDDAELRRDPEINVANGATGAPPSPGDPASSRRGSERPQPKAAGAKAAGAKAAKRALRRDSAIDVTNGATVAPPAPGAPVASRRRSERSQKTAGAKAAKRALQRDSAIDATNGATVAPPASGDPPASRRGSKRSRQTAKAGTSRKRG